MGNRAGSSPVARTKQSREADASLLCQRVKEPLFFKRKQGFFDRLSPPLQ